MGYTLGPGAETLIGIFGWVVGLGLTVIIGLGMIWVAIKLIEKIAKLLEEN